MVRFGYTLMTEQAGPRDLVAHASAAEHAGFDFEVISDHYSPWLPCQGHSPYAWSVLGAISQVTKRVELMTYVTCPTRRYHPAVVAQKAATRRAHEQFRWFAGGWQVNAELPGPSAFTAATQFVTEDDVAQNIPCGPDTEQIVTAVAKFWEAGFTDIALVQIGGDHQTDFFPFAEQKLLPALRSAAGN